MELVIIIALGAFFGWYDFSHHDNTKGVLTVACFALAIVITILKRKKTR